MARKNEFRPDSEYPGLLRRLLLTQKQRESVLRWGLAGALCLLGLLLQDAVLWRPVLFGATTDLVPCLVLLVVVLSDAESGSVFALTASCIYYFSGSAPGPQVIPILTGLAVLAVAFRQGYLQPGFWQTMLCVAAAMLLYELCLLAVGMVVGKIAFSRIGVLTLRAVLSLILVPAVYPAVRAIHKIGGETWNE